MYKEISTSTTKVNYNLNTIDIIYTVNSYIISIFKCFKCNKHVNNLK